MLLFVKALANDIWAWVRMGSFLVSWVVILATIGDLGDICISLGLMILLLLALQDRVLAEVFSHRTLTKLNFREARRVFQIFWLQVLIFINFDEIAVSFSIRLVQVLLCHTASLNFVKTTLRFWFIDTDFDSAFIRCLWLLLQHELVLFQTYMWRYKTIVNRIVKSTRWCIRSYVTLNFDILSTDTSFVKQIVLL